MGNLEDAEQARITQESFYNMVDAHAAWRGGSVTAEEAMETVEKYLIRISMTKIKLPKNYQIKD